MPEIESLPETSILLAVFERPHKIDAFQSSLLQTVSTLTRKKIVWEIVSFPTHVSEPEGRRRVFESFVQSKHTHLVCLDADLTFSAEDLAFLIETAEPGTVLGAACPLPKIRWGQVKDALAPLSLPTTLNTAEEAKTYSDQVAKVLAGCLEYSLVLPSQPTHEIVQGKMVVDTIGFGCTVVARDVAEKVLKTTEGGNAPEPFGDASTLSEVAFCNAVRETGGRVYVHVGMNVTRVAFQNFPGSLLDVFQQSGATMKTEQEPNTKPT